MTALKLLLAATMPFLGGCVALYHPVTNSRCYLRADSNVFIYFVDRVNITQKELNSLHSGGMEIDSGTHTLSLSISGLAQQSSNGDIAFTFQPNKIYILETKVSSTDKDQFYVLLLEHTLTGDSIVEQIPFKIASALEMFFRRH